MGKKGYPDGSLGIVVPWGDEYAPGQPALVNERIVRITSKDILDLLFAYDSTPDVEVVKPSDLVSRDYGWSKFEAKYGNIPILKIKSDVTLVPKVANDVMIIHAISDGGEVDIEGVGSLTTNIKEFVGGVPIKIGGRFSPTTPITIKAPVYLVAVEYTTLSGGEVTLLAYGTRNSASASALGRVELPGGSYVLEIGIRGNYNYGKTVSLKVNGVKVASALFNPGSGWFFKDYHLPVKVDTYSTLSITASADINPMAVSIKAIRMDEPPYSKPKAVTYTASETSTTASTTTAMSDVKPHRFRNISVQVSIASGGGSVKVLMNGNAVAEFTSSGTYTLPDFENIIKLEFEVAGDGINASSVTFSAIEEVKDIIVASLL